jgi:hypothetical protein
VTYVTAGYPTAEETVDILLGMEAGGAGKKHNSSTFYDLTNIFKMLLNLVYPSQTQLQMALPSKRRILFVHPRKMHLKLNSYISIASPQKWNHDHIGPGDGHRGTKEGTEGTNTLYGILQPNAQLWRRETIEGLPRGGSQWLHHGGLAARGSRYLQGILHKGRVSHYKPPFDTKKC